MNSNDYYFFLRSDFDFYSTIYKEIYLSRHNKVEGVENIYISNFYTIADSLSYPLFISPISKLDDDDTIDEKNRIISRFIDVYINIRTLTGKAITQSSIRNSMYELIKNIRNSNIDDLELILSSELSKSQNKPDSAFAIFHKMDNWGYYHYFFARVLFEISDKTENFSDLLRSKKQSSFVLVRMFSSEEIEDGIEIGTWEFMINSVAGYCLIKRYEHETVFSKHTKAKLQYLIKMGFLPEMNGFEYKDHSIADFINERDDVLRELVDKIWDF